jgi:hypothetical protein
MLMRIAQILLIVVFLAWTTIGSFYGSIIAVEHLADYNTIITALTALVTALATIFIAVFTATLSLATDKLREAGDRQAELTKILQRAYISAEPRGIHLLVQGDRVIGHIGITNAGKMPATNLSWFIDVKQSNKGDDQEFPLSDPKGSIIVVPGATAIRGSDKSVSLQKLLAAVGSVPESELPVYVYVWGTIRYSDGFNVTQTTNFCHRYNWIVRGKGNVGQYEIAAQYSRFHEYGNGAT